MTLWIGNGAFLNSSSSSSIINSKKPYYFRLKLYTKNLILLSLIMEVLQYLFEKVKYGIYL